MVVEQHASDRRCIIWGFEIDDNEKNVEKVPYDTIVEVRAGLIVKRNSLLWTARIPDKLRMGN